jgi:hypothetical protein
MEHEQRFERIEAALETMAKGLASLTTDSHKAFLSHNASQQTQMEQLIQSITRIGKVEIDVDALFKTAQKILEVQTLQGKNLESLVVIATAHAEENDDLKDKLHLLYEVVDTWIREHGSGRNGGTPKA